MYSNCPLTPKTTDSPISFSFSSSLLDFLPPSTRKRRLISCSDRSRHCSIPPLQLHPADGYIHAAWLEVKEGTSCLFLCAAGLVTHVSDVCSRVGMCAFWSYKTIRYGFHGIKSSTQSSYNQLWSALYLSCASDQYKTSFFPCTVCIFIVLKCLLP